MGRPIYNLCAAPTSKVPIADGEEHCFKCSGTGTDIGHEGMQYRKCKECAGSGKVPLPDPWAVQ